MTGHDAAADNLSIPVVLLSSLRQQEQVWMRKEERNFQHVGTRGHVLNAAMFAFMRHFKRYGWCRAMSDVAIQVLRHLRSDQEVPLIVQRA